MSWFGLESNVRILVFSLHLLICQLFNIPYVVVLIYLQVPYFQVRENNWTLNADANGKWNVRYDL